MKVGFISLGCSKNLVVTEEIMGLFKKNGYEITGDVTEAEIILINTCGFIDSAKDEAISTILEMADYKKANCKYLIVTGCLVQRYKDELIEELPEVDLFVSIKEYDELWKMINKLINNKQSVDYLNYKDRTITTGNSMAYLKIAEGCSNFCTFCAIPYIQGKYVSRKYEDILDEANRLVKNGIREIVVIAQDTTKYGIDLYGYSRLAELLNDLAKIEGLEWIRFLYSYPENIDDELIKVVKDNEKICNYFDIPIQHISDKILKKMNRKSDSKSIRNLLKKLRTEIPDVILRTTLIVGFPDQTAASKMPDQIDEDVKNIRQDKIMKLQQQISAERLREKVGKTYNCLIENITEDGQYYIGRTYMDVPSEDGVVYVQYEDGVLIDDFIEVTIIDSTAYDLYGIVKK